MSVIALITAAGLGTRMGQDIPKQFIHVDNKPIIIYTLEAFQKHPCIDSILVVTLPSWIDMLKIYAKQFNISKLHWVISGGDTGQQSIYNGIRHLSGICDGDTTVIIHDGNRCNISQAVIDDSIATYTKYGSSIAAIPCVEAIFESDDRGISSSVSIPREKLYRTQTPHVYSLNKLIWAHKQAHELNITNTTATCTLMQKLGEKIYFSKGSEENLKITTIDDLMIFKALLHTQKDLWLK